MKNKAILVSIVAVFAIVLTLNAVMASIVDVSIDNVEVNDVSVVGSTIAAGFVSENIPVEIVFTSNEDLEDVRVKVYVEGYRDEVSESTARFRVINGSTYIKRFSLDLPSSFDLDEDPEDLKLLIRISAKGKESFEDTFDIRMQKDLYSLKILSIDTDDKVAAGNVLALDIVLQNNGNERLDDTYVMASIPELGISKRVYFGDISSDIDEDYDEIRDSLNKRIYLTIPADAVSGIYNVEVEAYNYDAIVTANKRVIVSGIDSETDGTEDDVEDVEDADEAENNNAVLILTVILAIIFVVLLVVLIVLLTKKPVEVEEFGETSYY